MFEKIKNLKEKFREATTEQEENAIQLELDKLREENPEVWADAMLDNIQETVQEAKEFLVREKMEEIIKIISVSYLAEKYFQKTPQWFYQRMNGNTVNGKQAKFSPKEISVLNTALQDISKKIASVNI